MKTERSTIVLRCSLCSRARTPDHFGLTCPTCGGQWHGYYRTPADPEESSLAVDEAERYARAEQAEL